MSGSQPGLPGTGWWWQIQGQQCLETMTWHVRAGWATSFQSVRSQGSSDLALGPCAGLGTSELMLEAEAGGVRARSLLQCSPVQLPQASLGGEGHWSHETHGTAAP